MEENGRISEANFIEHSKHLNLGLSQDEIKQIVKTLAKYEDGIDFREFMIAAIDKRDLINEEMMRKAFNDMDDDGNGEIDVNELRTYFASKSRRNTKLTVPNMKKPKAVK